MGLIRAAKLWDLTIPSDYKSSHVHHEVTEVAQPFRPRRAGPTPVAAAAAAAGGPALSERQSSFSHRLGLSKHGTPSLSPLSLRAGANSETASPIHKAAGGARVACGGARAYAMSKRGTSGASRPPLQPRRPSQNPAPTQRSRSLPASPPPQRRLLCAAA